METVFCLMSTTTNTTTTDQRPNHHGQPVHIGSQQVQIRNKYHTHSFGAMCGLCLPNCVDLNHHQIVWFSSYGFIYETLSATRLSVLCCCYQWWYDHMVDICVNLYCIVFGLCLCKKEHRIGLYRDSIYCIWRMRRHSHRWMANVWVWCIWFISRSL